jgi:SAM-dependent MidA family methyltransferase
MPASVRGVVLANELLDALPAHAVMMTGTGLREVFVDLDRDSEREPRFVERLRDPSNPRLTEYLARAGAVMHRGARAEVNLAAEEWVKSAAGSLRQGFMIVIDYGHDEGELYGASHASGTLTSFRQHSQLADFLQMPGECDITAHVDLTAIVRAAERGGLDVLGRLDQTYFLLGLGIADLENLSLQQRLAMKTLVFPGGLGSTHKVLIFGKDVGRPALKGLSYRVRLT